ncbi:hypothetical protein HVPorG_04226 [Roseomonas mucosa]|nr:hypothetical protein HVIM_04226 [Roseomonas mucosa]QDD99162.1 hypothetical protein ADP8_04226 [Roseomonas mucosa]QDJ08875.1 hypothetical protein HVPorG_04226 [Roseomonas mucosa]UZO96207.1 hypothetical protein RMHFA_04226 [Roseomonas mucosa]
MPEWAAVVPLARGKGSAFPRNPHPPGAGGSWTCRQLARTAARSRRRAWLSGNCGCHPVPFPAPHCVRQPCRLVPWN